MRQEQVVAGDYFEVLSFSMEKKVFRLKFWFFADEFLRLLSKATMKRRLEQIYSEDISPNYIFH